MLGKDQVIETNIENYVLVNNVDETIQLLNPILSPLGYEFVLLDFFTLETKFKSLFNLPKKYDYDLVVDISGKKISLPFYYALMNSDLIDKIDTGYVCFLKSKKVVHQTIEIKGGVMKLDERRLKHAGEVQKFANDLLQKLRLFKNGAVEMSRFFQYNTNNNHIGSILSAPRVAYRREIYSISPSEVEGLEFNILQEFELNQLSIKAKAFFDLSYGISECSVRFVTLMTALETLFNRGRDQITHIVSRHLAVLLSSNEEEFKMNYKQVKKLYGIRSKIVHGSSSVDKDVCEKCAILQGYVRRSILKITEIGLEDKDELFEYLNMKGIR